MKTKKEIKKPEQTGLVLERPHATRAQRREVLKKMPQWELYKQYMMGKKFGKIAFREFLPEYKNKWSPDSGPIIAGYGVAATGLGLNAASSIGDWNTYIGIKNMMNPFGFTFGCIDRIIGNNIFTRIGTDLLASSIWLNAETKNSWY